MSKYLNRLKARLAMQKRVESAKQGKNLIVTKKLVLEAEDADLELEPGDSVEVGANDNGDMVVGSKAAVVVITSPEVAEQVANAVVNADELSDVEFVTRDAMDALESGEGLDDVVDALGDAPDYHFIPVGNAGNITAYWKGYVEYFAENRDEVQKLTAETFEM